MRATSNDLNKLIRVAFPLVAALVLACTESGTQGPGTPPPGGQPNPAGGPVTHDGLEYRADVAVMESFPVQLAGRATVTNPGGAPKTVTFPDGCIALLRVYREAGGEPVWDQSSEVGCTMALVPVTVAPGAPQEFRTPTASAYDILGDDLPDGAYRLVVYLRPDGAEVEVPAGTTELAIPR